MPDGFDTHEAWPFECLRCLYVWEEDFVVRRLSDNHGNQVVLWLRAGVTVPPPWTGACCPLCGGYRVTSFPAGYLARHPELLAEPEVVAAPLFVPVIEPDRVPAQRTHLPGRLLVALGVPLAAFVAYELYVNLVAAAHPHH
ncbi:hypothetical protein [Nonomuraea sp. NPDC002799]